MQTLKCTAFFGGLDRRSRIHLGLPELPAILGEQLLESVDKRLEPLQQPHWR